MIDCRRMLFKMNFGALRYLRWFTHLAINENFKLENDDNLYIGGNLFRMLLSRGLTLTILKKI